MAKPQLDKVRLDQEDIEYIFLDLIKNMNGSVPDLIIGPSRGGLIPGTYFSHYFDVPFLPVIFSTRDHKANNLDNLAELYKDFKSPLIIDDINDSGKTFIELTSTFGNVKTACLFEKTSSLFRCDFVGDYIKPYIWIEFPWEYLLRSKSNF